MLKSRKEADKSQEAKYLALHTSLSKEITRLRNDQWVMSGYFISEAVGVIYLFRSETLKGIIIPHFTKLTTLIQFAAIIMFVYHIFRLHRFLFVHRSIRRRLERKLGFHHLTGSDGEYIMPDAWRSNAVDRWFEFNSIILPLAVFVILVQTLSILVVWGK
jgi:hypothetical protein